MGWSGIASFFGQVSKVKIEQGLQAATAALASLDPEAASQAQIEMLDDKLDTLREKLVRAQRDVDKDLAETAAWETKAEQIRQALRILKSQLENAEETAKPGIMDKAHRLAASLQQAQNEVEREKREDAEKLDILNQIQAIHDQVKQRRNTMESQLQQARNRMESAKLREESARLKEQQTRELAGLAGGFDTMGIALDAMNKAAEEAEVAAAKASLASQEMNARGGNQDEQLLADILGAASKPATSDPFAGI